jgi:NAD dependent epimerase/dehydratase
MSLQGSKILITGADGFIGSHLVERVAEAGGEVTALALYNSFDSRGWLDDLRPELAESIRFERGDVRDGAFMMRLMEGQEYVFHLAALIAIPFSYAAPASYVETNIQGTLNVLEAARRAGIRRLVHTSTSEVYGTARVTPMSEDHPLQGQSPYSASKIGADMMVEAFARSFDAPAVILRPFNTFGPRQSERAIVPTIVRQALDPAVDAIMLGDTSPRRDLTFVDDTVSAFLAAATAPNLEYGKPYNAGSGKAITVGELAAILSRLTGANKPISIDPKRHRPEKSEVRELVADASRLKRATGWRPRVSLEDGLMRTVTWWRQRLSSGAVRRSTGYAT